MNKRPHSLPQHRMTRQRRIILDVLEHTDAHPTADEVYRAVRRRLPRVSLATVYRNLDLLETEGSIGKVRFGDGAAHYDGHAGPHHHVRCVQCGSVADVPPEFCHIRPGELDRATGFRLVDCQVEIAGLCPKCSKQGHGDAEKRRHGDKRERHGEAGGAETRGHGDRETR